MTDHDLDELMERLGDRTPVGPPPLGPLRDAARRSSRRRLVAAAMATTAVIAVVGGTALAVGLGGGGGGDGRGGDVVAPDAGFTPPPGTRLVGIGHLAVAVPEDWGTNETNCGTPTKDTVVVDQGAICLALVRRPADVESVELRGGDVPAEGEATDPVDVDGHAGELTPVECDASPEGTERGEVCRAVLFVPEQRASVVLSSSSDDAADRVHTMLSWVQWTDELVAVPGFQSIDIDHQDDNAGAHYRRELEAYGFVAETVTEKRPGMKPGFVLGVDPAPGTMLEPGSVVTVTVVAEPAGPAEEISVGLNSIGPGGSMDYRGLEDAEIRSGTGRVVVPVGGEVWFYSKAEDHVDGRLVGEVDGDAVRLDPRTDGPNAGRTWDAVRPGTARLTISLERDSRRYEIGTVTVVVR